MSRFGGVMTVMHPMLRLFLPSAQKSAANALVTVTTYLCAFW
jgi:hypothetical protein